MVSAANLYNQDSSNHNWKVLTSMMIPAPRIPETDANKCRGTGCDGFYQPYPDGSLSCYCGSVSSLSTDDVEVPGLVLVSLMDEC
ncbi:hypothetical protein SEA_PATELGO_252 [Streptomyces phage Patelgo]|nr:hypothetical protein SEA_PATELGO_252 [Streptomyces phage Patelgo]